VSEERPIPIPGVTAPRPPTRKERAAAIIRPWIVHLGMRFHPDAEGRVYRHPVTNERILGDLDADAYDNDILGVNAIFPEDIYLLTLELWAELGFMVEVEATMISGNGGARG
jgi:hypothetical protein